MFIEYWLVDFLRFARVELNPLVFPTTEVPLLIERSLGFDRLLSLLLFFFDVIHHPDDGLGAIFLRDGDRVIETFITTLTRWL